MKKKVSLKEIVGTQIVYAVMLATYYWMWARTDWKDSYMTIQYVLGALFAAFFAFQAYRMRRYRREGVDEMAEMNLRRCDAICLKLFLAAMVATAWIGGVFGHVSLMGTAAMGWIIVLSIVALSVVRTILFAVMDSRGM